MDIKRIAVHIKLARQKKQGFQIEKKNVGNFFDLEHEIRDIYSLTKSEARLCNNLLNGLSLEETAEKTSLKYCTLKGYLKTIFIKTNTKKQHELVSQIMKDLIFYG